MSWTWDPTLYAGSAPHYAVGRVAYPQGVAAALVGAVPLDGGQRLLDVGCGPGSLTLLLAPHVAEAIGVDADGDMLAEAARLVERYLGAVRRAGQGRLPSGTSGGEDDVFRAAGFSRPSRIEVPGRVVERSVEEVASSIYSLSSSAPHLFGSRLAEFDGELRALLVEASDDGRFSEQMRSITLSIWR